eukprot:6196541-Pleurochrysis_carterae.AAC.10
MSDVSTDKDYLNMSKMFGNKRSSTASSSTTRPPALPAPLSDIGKDAKINDMGWRIQHTELWTLASRPAQHAFFKLADPVCRPRCVSRASYPLHCAVGGAESKRFAPAPSLARLASAAARRVVARRCRHARYAMKKKGSRQKVIRAGRHL